MDTKIKRYFDSIAKNNKVLSFAIFRTDRIGDTVLSIQTADLVKKHFPQSKITFVVREYTKPVLENNPSIDDVITIDNLTIRDLSQKLKQKKIDVSISLFASKESVYAPFFAQIPIRIGPMSKFRSLLFNVKIIQKRSMSIKNEAEYNLDLLKPLGIENEMAYPKINLRDEEIEFGKKYFDENRRDNPMFVPTQKLIILHPGSGGSSKDWALERYFKLAKSLETKGFEVFITGSDKEIDLYKSRKYLEQNELSKDCLLDKQLDMRKFFAVIKQADVFVSNSTGPLHCAVALGVKTISFYPPLKVCKSLRWGPFAEDMTRHFVFTPDLSECMKCSRDCRYFLCMDMISEDAVLKKIFEFTSDK